MNKQRATDQKFSPTIMVVGSYMLTSVIGVPLWFVGVLLHQPRLSGAWSSMANSFAGICIGEELERAKHQKQDSSEVKDFMQASLDRNHLLSVNSVSERFTRVVMHTAEAGVRQRIDLPDIFEGELEMLGIDNTLPAAMSYTMRQIENGVHSESLPKIGCIHRATPGSDDKNKHQAEKSVDVPRSVPVTSPTPNANGDSQAKPSGSARSKGQGPQKAKGQVVFAGSRRVNVSGQKAYQTFAVVLNDQGREFTFSGIDLEEKFNEGVFQEGDLVEITQLGKVWFTVQQGGKTENRTKNQFKVLKLA